MSINDQRSPYLVPRNSNTSPYATEACGVLVHLTHRALCLSSARIWSLGFSPNLLGKDRKKNKNINTASVGWLDKTQKCEDISGNKLPAHCLDLLVKEIFVHDS